MFDVSITVLKFLHFPPCIAIFLVYQQTCLHVYKHGDYLLTIGGAYPCPQGPVGIIWPFKWQNNQTKKLELMWNADAKKAELRISSSYII